MYKVVKSFPERFDKDHVYNVGDAYPRDEFLPTKGRIKELLDGTNRAGAVFIERIIPADSTPSDIMN